VTGFESGRQFKTAQWYYVSFALYQLKLSVIETWVTISFIFNKRHYATVQQEKKLYSLLIF
jgi:hypothetical protein